jgi:hypothetical protein
MRKTTRASVEEVEEEQEEQVSNPIDIDFKPIGLFNTSSLPRQITSKYNSVEARQPLATMSSQTYRMRVDPLSRSIN